MVSDKLSLHESLGEVDCHFVPDSVCFEHLGFFESDEVWKHLNCLFLDT
jgi:hypothetical protein